MPERHTTKKVLERTEKETKKLKGYTSLTEHVHAFQFTHFVDTSNERYNTVKNMVPKIIQLKLIINASAQKTTASIHK